MVKQDRALPQTRQQDALCRNHPQPRSQKKCRPWPVCEPALVIPHLQKDFGMEEAFPFSPLPPDAGNAASPEPIAAERMARSVDGLTKERGWVAKRGTFSWQGGSLQQCWYREATSNIRAEPRTRAERAARETNSPSGTRKYSSKGDKKLRKSHRNNPPPNKTSSAQNKSATDKAFESSVFISCASRYL